MVSTINASVLGDRIDDLLERVSDEREVILEREGQPRAVLITAQTYDELQQLRAERRRREAGDRLEALREQIVARNRDLTAEEADAIARRAVSEAIESLADRGKLVFERRLRQSS